MNFTWITNLCFAFDWFYYIHVASTYVLLCECSNLLRQHKKVTVELFLFCFMVGKDTPMGPLI